MDEKRQVNLYINTKDLQKIDEAAKLEMRSRTQFLIYHSTRRAKELTEGKHSIA